MATTHDPRRLIKFGNSSYIVSLPREWIKKNNLKKGDIVYIGENGDSELAISSKEKSDVPREKEIVINVEDKDLEEIQRRITAAYINNYSTITLKGDAKKELINKALSHIGLEVIYQTRKETVVKDFLNIGGVSPKKIIRRIDNIIRSMFEDMKAGLRERAFREWLYKEIAEVDQRINKFYFLVWKVAKKGQEWPAILTKLKISQKELSDTQWITLHLEYIGDEIKRTARFLVSTRSDVKEKERLLKIIYDVEKNYIDTMTAYYQNNKDLAFTTLKKEKIIIACKKLAEHTKLAKMGGVAEKLKSVVSSIHYISKILAY